MNKDIQCRYFYRIIQIWIWQNGIYWRDVRAIGKHINNALKKELANSVVVNFATTASDGKEFNNELIRQKF